MAKVAKTPQTEWTTGGRDISNTAIPLYQENLTRVDDYLSNPQSYMQNYLDTYFSGNADQSNFLRNYRRSMAGTTSNNYGATNGGYASLNQRNYDDTQRYWNDLASRLQTVGVANAYNMASQDYVNMLNAFPYYQSAYQLGQPYSEIEQQNAIADQQNSNWLGNLVGGVGQVVSAIPHPAAAAIGSAMQVGGDMMTVQAPTYGTSSNLRSAGVGAGGAYANPYSGIANQLNTTLKGLAADAEKHPLLNAIYGGGGTSTSNTSSGLFNPNSPSYYGNRLNTNNSNSLWRL